VHARRGGTLGNGNNLEPPMTRLDSHVQRTLLLHFWKYLRHLLARLSYGQWAVREWRDAVAPLYEDSNGKKYGLGGDFLVYVDETGHEEFADARHPVFGFGACAATAETVEQLLLQPWAEFKRENFGSSSYSLHSCKIKRTDITPARADAARAFFRNSLFCRAAAMVRANTKIDPKLEPNAAYSIAGAALVRRIIEIFKWHSSGRIVLIFERSQRLDPLADSAFPRPTVSEDGKDIPVELCRMPKGDLGLEVADFVAHTAGRKARIKAGGTPAHSEFVDFAAVFRSVPEKFVSYLEIDSATLSPKPSPQT
jgi:hypothetical protein